MAKHRNITAEYARQLLDYDPETGILTWKHRSTSLFISEAHAKTWNKRWAGKFAGSLKTIGYYYISINRERIQSHRVIWLILTGSWPVNHIDHINGDRADNRAANLREATASENAQNRPRQSNNKSGFAGVSWSSRERKWNVNLKLNRKKIYVGLFDSPEDAYAAYLKAKAIHHKFQPVPRE